MSDASKAEAVAEAMTTLWTNEIPSTLRVLSAVPDSERDFRPHPRSRSAWELVVHIATADLWFIDGIERGVFQFAPDAVKALEEQFRSVADVTAFYEATIPTRLARLSALGGEKLAEFLDFPSAGNMSRAAWIGIACHHSIHHRGQLSAYLRGLGSKVPDIYGPSGDAEPITEPQQIV